MRSQKVLEGQTSVVPILLVLELQGLGELGRGGASGLIQELEDSVAEAVVHHPIERLVEPGAGIAERVRRIVVPPDLTGDVGLRVDRLHPTSELPPESQGHFSGHIHAPTVDAILGVAVPVGIHPPAHDRMEMRAHLKVQIL